LREIPSVSRSRPIRRASSALPEFFAEDLHRNRSMIRMPGAEHGGRAAFTYLAQQLVSGDRLTHKILSCHAANLTAGVTRGKRKAGAVHYDTMSVARRRNGIASRARAIIACACMGIGVVGCGAAHRALPPALPLGPLERAPTPVIINASAAYQQAGYLVGAGEIPFVGDVHAFAGDRPDSTKFVIAFSFPNRDLTFVRDGEQYRAAYDVSYGLRSGGALVARRTAHSEVRVASFRETTRTEESVVVQQPLSMRPGSYTLDLSVRDNGSTNAGLLSQPISLPTFPVGGVMLASAAVYEVTPRRARSEAPAMVVNPRATVTLGEDSTLDVYVEGTGASPDDHVRVQVSADGVGVLYEDTLQLDVGTDVRSGVAHLPVDRIGLGVLTIAVVDDRGARAAPIAAVVRPADGLAVGSFREMLEYLRYFTSDARLRTVRESDASTLAEAWSRFMRNTDPDPGTARNEAMIEYFRRLEQANERFGEGESAGWSTPRGRVFAAFGPPDATDEPALERADKPGARLVWSYREPAMRFVFVDRTGRGDWQLDAASTLEFTTALSRLTWCGRCG